MNTTFGCDEHATNPEWCKCVHYTVPESGYYAYTQTTTMFKHTGQYKLQDNPHRRWFQFWKPRQVLKEVILTVEEPTARAIGYFARGDVIDTHGTAPEKQTGILEF